MAEMPAFLQPLQAIFQPISSVCAVQVAWLYFQIEATKPLGRNFIKNKQTRKLLLDLGKVERNIAFCVSTLKELGNLLHN